MLRFARGTLFAVARYRYMQKALKAQIFENKLYVFEQKTESDPNMTLTKKHMEILNKEALKDVRCEGNVETQFLTHKQSVLNVTVDSLNDEKGEKTVTINVVGLPKLPTTTADNITLYKNIYATAGHEGIHAKYNHALVIETCLFFILGLYPSLIPFINVIRSALHKMLEAHADIESGLRLGTAQEFAKRLTNKEEVDAYHTFMEKFNGAEGETLTIFQKVMNRFYYVNTHPSPETRKLYLTCTDMLFKKLKREPKFSNNPVIQEVLKEREAFDKENTSKKSTI